MPDSRVLPRSAVEEILGFPLSDEQWQCVSAPLEPFVIVAGAGTGKTTVMAARVLWLVASGLVAPQQVLGLTFTNKAAAELAHRVTTLLNRWQSQRPADRGDTVGEPTVATYHSFASRLITEQGLRVGIEPGARLLTGPAVAQLAFRAVCEAHGLVHSRNDPSSLAQAVLRLDANLAEQTITTDELRLHDEAVVAEADALPRTTARIRGVRETALRRIELAGLVDDLRRSKELVGGLGFEDHMRLCVDLVRGSDELVTAMRGTYRVILLDEYQDTSIAQRVILSSLFRGCGVTAVGDPMQAIYGWRSASVANIEAFGEHFGVEGRAPVRVLSVNRRSGEPILAAANRIAEGLRSLHPQIATLCAPAPRGARVRAALLGTVVEERGWIADRVAELVASGTPPEHIGVLGRANDDLGPLRDAIVARGVPASISGAAAITASPYAVAVLATLRVLADPTDNTAVTALLAGPRWRIGPRDLERLGARARATSGSRARASGSDAESADVTQRLADLVAVPDPVQRPSLLEAASDPGPGISVPARERLADFSAEMRLLHAHVGDPLADLTALVVAVTGAGVEAALAAGPDGQGDVGLVGLLRLVDEFADAEGRAGLGAFIAYLDAAEQFGAGEQVELPALPGSVQLMTMHKAKGLEWPVVVLPHLCQGVFPSSRASDRWTTIPHVVPIELRDDRHVLPAFTGWSKADLDGFEEACRSHDRTGEDRLAYVAVTRARDAVIASGHWWGPTQTRPRGPSDYLRALRTQADATAASDADSSVSAAGTPHAYSSRGAAGTSDAHGSSATAGNHGDPWADDPRAVPEDEACTNPMLDEVVDVPWPVPLDDAGVLRMRAAQAVEALASQHGEVPDPPPWAERAVAPDAGAQGTPGQRAMAPGARVPGAPAQRALAPQDDADPRVVEVVAGWDAAILSLLARSEHPAGQVPRAAVPEVLSASATMGLAADAHRFALDLLRPMPRRRNRHAELGTAFHAWVEARLGLQPLIADDDLPGAADEGVASPAELAALKESFERLPYANRAPTGLEVPFSLAVAGRVIRGRIDAVFPAGADAGEGILWEVVDWKTSSSDVADPLQLAIYRLAWADIQGVQPEQVAASFVFVRTGTVQRPDHLPGAEQLAELIAGESGGAHVGLDRSPAPTRSGARTLMAPGSSRSGRSGR